MVRVRLHVLPSFVDRSCSNVKLFGVMLEYRDRERNGLPSASVPFDMAVIAPPAHSDVAGENVPRYASADETIHRRAVASYMRVADVSERGLPDSSVMRNSSMMPQPSRARHAFHVPSIFGTP